MSRHNHQPTPTEKDLHEARTAHGRRSRQAGSAADGYAESLGEQITNEVHREATDTQQGWDRTGTPWWMRVKTALGWAGRRG